MVRSSINNKCWYSTQGVKLPLLASEPTCNSDNEGLLIVNKTCVASGGSTCDLSRYYKICLKTGSSSYGWQAITSTSWSYTCDKDETCSCTSSGEPECKIAH